MKINEMTFDDWADAVKWCVNTFNSGLSTADDRAVAKKIYESAPQDIIHWHHYPDLTLTIDTDENLDSSYLDRTTGQYLIIDAGDRDEFNRYYHDAEGWDISEREIIIFYK